MQRRQVEKREGGHGGLAHARLEGHALQYGPALLEAWGRERRVTEHDSTPQRLRDALIEVALPAQQTRAIRQPDAHGREGFPEHRWLHEGGLTGTLAGPATMALGGSDIPGL